MGWARTAVVVCIADDRKRKFLSQRTSCLQVHDSVANELVWQLPELPPFTGGGQPRRLRVGAQLLYGNQVRRLQKVSASGAKARPSFAAMMKGSLIVFIEIVPQLFRPPEVEQLFCFDNIDLFVQARSIHVISASWPSSDELQRASSTITTRNRDRRR